MLQPDELRVLNSVVVYEHISNKALHIDVLAFKYGKNETADLFYFGSEKIYCYDATISIVHARGSFLLQAKPMHVGFKGIDSVVNRASLRIAEGHSLGTFDRHEQGWYVPARPPRRGWTHLGKPFIGSWQQLSARMPQ